MTDKAYPRQKKLSPTINASVKVQRSLELRQLHQYAEAISSLEEKLSRALPSQLSALFKVNTLKQGTLTITCAKATHKALFLANQHDILTTLNGQLPPKQRVAQVNIKVKPVIRKPVKARPRGSLSEANAQLLEAEAELTEDQALKRALTNIARSSQNP